MYDYDIMSEIHEAPIVHGTISVSTFSTKAVEFSTTSFDSIDTSINQSSQNPVTNIATKSSLDSTTPPLVSAFSARLIKFNNLTSIGQIYFDYVAQEINTFGTGGTNDGKVIAPTSGTYLITSKVDAITQSNALNITLKLNGAEIKNSTKNGVLLMTTLTFVDSGGIISLHSNNDTQSQTTFEVTLIKPDQTV